MRTFMRRGAMAVIAAAMAAAAVDALMRGERQLTWVAAGLILWAGVEAFIAAGRSYQAIVPRSRLVAASRGLWLAAAVYSWLDARFGWTRIFVSDPAGDVLGALTAAGAALRLWAVIHLGRSFSYDVKRPEAGVLIQTGPYRLVRHPAYLGLMIVSTLFGLAAGSVVGFAALVATTVVSTVARVEAEDRMLDAEFGEAHRSYGRRTWRLVPFLY